MKLFKQFEEIGYEVGCAFSIIIHYSPLFSIQREVGEVFDEEDSVSIIKEEGSRAGRAKNIKNNLNTEIRLVVHSTRKSKPVFLPVGSTKAVSFCVCNFSNKIEIYTILL